MQRLPRDDQVKGTEKLGINDTQRIRSTTNSIDDSNCCASRPNLVLSLFRPNVFLWSIYFPRIVCLFVSLHCSLVCLLTCQILLLFFCTLPPRVACQAQINFCTIFRPNRGATHGHQLQSKTKHIQLLESYCISTAKRCSSSQSVPGSFPSILHLALVVLICSKLCLNAPDWIWQSVEGQ